MNWLCVHTVATVVISLIVTLAGGWVPTDAINAMAWLSPLDGFAVGLPPFAARYRIDPLGADAALIENRPSAPVRAWPNCCGLPALAAKSVTVELTIGAPPPSTWPAMSAAAAVVQNTVLTRAGTAAANIAFASPLRMRLLSITRIALSLGLRSLRLNQVDCRDGRGGISTEQQALDAQWLQRDAPSSSRKIERPVHFAVASSTSVTPAARLAPLYPCTLTGCSAKPLLEPPTRTFAPSPTAQAASAV